MKRKNYTLEIIISLALGIKLIIILSGCCRCPEPFAILPSGYLNQEEARRETREINQLELQKQQLELQR